MGPAANSLTPLSTFTRSEGKIVKDVPMPDNPISVESSSRVFQGRVFSTVVDRVRLPHGALVDMEVVRHPASVVLIPMGAEQQALLGKQDRYAVDRWIWV